MYAPKTTPHLIHWAFERRKMAAKIIIEADATAMNTVSGRKFQMSTRQNNEATYCFGNHIIREYYYYHYYYERK